MKSKLSDTVLEQLATQSKLELTDSDKTELRRDLVQMLTYVDKLRELNTEDSPTLTHFPECICKIDTVRSVSSAPAQSSSPLREDIPGSQLPSELLLSLAPRKDDRYYIVPNTF